VTREQRQEPQPTGRRTRPSRSRITKTGTSLGQQIDGSLDVARNLVPGGSFENTPPLGDWIGAVVGGEHRLKGGS